MRYFYFSLLIFSHAIHAFIYPNRKQNVLSTLDDLRNDSEGTDLIQRRASLRYFQKKQEDEKDKQAAQNKASVLKNVRTHEKNINVGRNMPSSKWIGTQDSNVAKEYFHMDPVLNELRHRRFDFRRKNNDDDDSSNSNTDDERSWKDDFKELWLQKKIEALNSTLPRGDVVNMVAARPWGVPCGDPNQHDTPWGNCMLPAECDAEYRIYRGDYFCGRTAYVCCAIIVTNYDMYPALDISFEGSSFDTDSNENSKGDNGTKPEKTKKKKRNREREKRKKKIQKTIRRIVNEIRKILNKAYRNGTAQRKKKTKELQKFIEMMKKQYKKDRKSVVNLHKYEMENIDNKLQAKLDKIKGVNEAYMNNDTFREIVVNGTVDKEKLKYFLQMHPEWADLLENRRTGLNLKPEMVDLEPKSEKEDSGSEKENPKVLQYDIEYGMLYY